MLHFSVSSQSGQAAWTTRAQMLEDRPGEIGLAVDIGVDPRVGLHRGLPALAPKDDSDSARRLKAAAATPARRGRRAALDAEDGERRPDRAEADDVGGGQRLAEDEHREQELQRRRDILEEAEGRIRQPLGRRGEQQQRHRGDRAAEDQQQVDGRARRRPKPAVPWPAARAPAERDRGEHQRSRSHSPSSASTGATLRRKP